MVTRFINGERIEFTEEQAIVYDTMVKVLQGLTSPLEATQYFISLAEEEEKELVEA